MPPAIAETTRVSLQLLKLAEDKRDYLKNLIHYFQTCATELGLKIITSLTPIQPILIGDNLTTQLLAKNLKKAGFLVGSIRPPTVPKNTARLRIALTVHHTKSHIDHLLETIVTQLKIIREQTCIS